MSRKIATPAAVFAACEALEESGKPWNRDDVRQIVGGGGFSVIDPLIQAWRKIKPLKAVAPQTPTELLHAIAGSIEAHLSEYIQNIETRDSERARVFENSAHDLSSKIEALETESSKIQSQLECADQEINQQHETNHALSEQIHQLTQTNAKLQAENDELRGFSQRLESQIREDRKQNSQTIQQLENAQEKKVRAIHAEHKQELTRQKKELIQQYELSENRLMRIIEHERSEAKEQLKEQQSLLIASRQAERGLSKENAQLTMEVRKLNEQIQSLEGTLLKKESENSELKALRSTLQLLTEKMAELGTPEQAL